MDLTRMIATYHRVKSIRKEEEQVSNEKNWCCFIDPETKAQCRADAEWLVVTGNSPDDATEACTAHVGYLLVDKPFNHVFPIQR